MQRRLLLIGQAPGRGGDPSRPLEGRIGRRLAEMIGVSFDEYLLIAERTNLLTEWTGKKGKGDSWDALAARERASELRQVFPGRVAVLLGRNVARAFGLGDLEWLAWMDFCEGAVGAIPHPSGIVIWWNDPANRSRAFEFLREALGRLR